MQIMETIPSVVEKENTIMRTIIFVQNWKSGLLLFATLGIMYFTTSGFVILICIFPTAGNYFEPN